MKKEPKISEKIEQLKGLTDWFYGDEFKLDVAIEKYTQAANLAKEIGQDLDVLKNEIKIIEEDFAKK